MLTFRYHEEQVQGRQILRPRLTVMAHSYPISIEMFPLLDSGADTSIVPEAVALALGLKRGPRVHSRGIGGMVLGYQSTITLRLIDSKNKQRIIKNLPVNVMPSFRDVVLGRRVLFDLFKITFDQPAQIIHLDPTKSSTSNAS